MFTVEKLKKQDHTRMILRIPESLNKVIEEYQDALKLRFGSKGSKHDIVLEMMLIGVNGISNKTNKYLKEYESYHSVK